MKKTVGIFTIFLAVLLLCFYKEDILKMCGFSYRQIYNVTLTGDEIEALRKELEIIDIEYEWRSNIEEVNSPRILVYHHTAIKEISPEGIDSLHKNKGWNGIGYHYYIRKDGRIYTGRPEKYEGSHVKGYNKESIGVCLEGDFEEEIMSEEQMKSLEKLSVYLCVKYDISNIIPHKKLGATLCPGKNFPVEEIRDNTLKQLKK